MFFLSSYCNHSWPAVLEGVPHCVCGIEHLGRQNTLWIPWVFSRATLCVRMLAVSFHSKSLDRNHRMSYPLWLHYASHYATDFYWCNCHIHRLLEQITHIVLFPEWTHPFSDYELITTHLCTGCWNRSLTYCCFLNEHIHSLIMNSSQLIYVHIVYVNYWNRWSMARLQTCFKIHQTRQLGRFSLFQQQEEARLAMASSILPRFTGLFQRSVGK